MMPQLSYAAQIAPKHKQSSTGSVVINALSPRRHCLRAQQTKQKQKTLTPAKQCNLNPSTRDSRTTVSSTMRALFIIPPPRPGIVMSESTSPALCHVRTTGVSHNDPREPKRALWVGHALKRGHNSTKKTPTESRKSEIGGGRRKNKERNWLPPFGLPVRGLVRLVRGPRGLGGPAGGPGWSGQSGWCGGWSRLVWLGVSSGVVQVVRLVRLVRLRR